MALKFWNDVTESAQGSSYVFIKTLFKAWLGKYTVFQYEALMCTLEDTKKELFFNLC